MYSAIQTAVLNGIDTVPVSVEVDISSGLPMFEMVGHLSCEVREARERVRTALHNCSVVLPTKKITVNLSPANVKKTGTGFDLPLAVALLMSMGRVKDKWCQQALFIGELGLNGQIQPVNGILPVVSDGKKRGIDVFVVPKENIEEARLVEDAKVYGFASLNDLIQFLNTGEYQDIEPVQAEKEIEHSLDFADVNGQGFLKRACEVAAAGMHNLLMIGPPGAGKTMISERVSTILPSLTKDEKLELSKIYSVCGKLTRGNVLIEQRPFRRPHHTITQVGLTGGGLHPRPGEISLAHHGVLFLDELPEFHKSTLEILRQPMEERKIHITRSGGRVVYPSDFLLLASMNPCSCGYYPDMQRCRCSAGSVRRYLGKISQPLIDRMDICVEAPQLSYEDLKRRGEAKQESSADIRERVERCHQIQYERYREEPFCHNSQIPSSRLEEYCGLGEKQEIYMKQMFQQLGMTARTYHKILRVARTIADLDECKEIQLSHLNEAVCYRSIDEKYWGGILA